MARIPMTGGFQIMPEGEQVLKIVKAEYDEDFNEIPGTATSDNRTIEGRSRNGDKRAQLVEQMLCHQLVKYIGGFAAAMGGVDAVVFTGGIGENSANYRASLCEKLGFLGIIELGDLLVL